MKQRIKRAPISFFTVFAITLGALWWGFSSYYSGRIKFANDTVSDWKGISERWKSESDYWKERATTGKAADPPPVGLGKPTSDNYPKVKPQSQSDEPRLLLSMMRPDLFTPTGMNGMTGVIVNAKIWNVGQPSVVTGWALTITPRDGSPQRQENAVPINPAGLHIEGVSALNISATEDITIKTKSVKVQKVPVEGVARFYFLAPMNVVSASDFVLTATDINGRGFTATYPVKLQ